VRFLFNGKGVGVYRVVAVAFVAGGALLHVDLVWQLADLFNGLMVIPNLVALWALNKVVVNHLAEFEHLLEKSVRE
ncbi:MAG: alanine:cation symporter family protein, partial [Desulfovibrio sp.]|nr:alanine:cation symporter family protein [Desulfovibrio sp.]